MVWSRRRRLFSFGYFAFTSSLVASPPVDCFQPISLTSAWSSAAHVIEHLASPPRSRSEISLDDIANTRIPGPPGSGVEIAAFIALPSSDASGKGRGGGSSRPAIILLHEFFGLNPSIADKARGLADDLGSVVIAPDTFRGAVTEFIPRAIWLALTTPQGRVNDDLDAARDYLTSSGLSDLSGGLAVVGFCYGGGKAIRYTSGRRPEAATVVFYGSPVTDPEELRRLRAPVCGVFGDRDAQFPRPLLDKFRSALDAAGVENDIKIYEGVGHAFWKDMGQVKRGEEPQTQAYKQAVDFLRSFFVSKRT